MGTLSRCIGRESGKKRNVGNLVVNKLEAMGGADCASTGRGPGLRHWYGLRELPFRGCLWYSGSYPKHFKGDA